MQRAIWLVIPFTLAIDSANAMPVWMRGDAGAHELFLGQLLTMGGAVAMALVLGIGVFAARWIGEAKRRPARNSQG